MNYQKIYEQLTAKDMIADYTEKHHIIPKCMGGSNDPTNLVRLTPEAHYVAHQLLVKIYPDNHKLLFAAHRMSSGKYRNNKLYSWLKRNHAAAMRERSPSAETRKKISQASKGRPSRKKGIPLSAETKAKLSAALKGRVSTKPRKSVSDETKAKLSVASKGRTSPNKGKPLSAETKAKLSIAGKGRPKSDDHKAKISAAHKGKTHSASSIEKMRLSKQNMSADTKAKMSYAKQNKPKIICPHCGKEGSTNMKRYHFNNCKHI